MVEVAKGAGTMNPLRTLLLAALCLLPLAASAQYQPQTKIYLKLNGIVGESQDAGHQGEIEIIATSFGVNQAGLALAGGAASAAKSQFTTIALQKRTDQTSPFLFLNCALGKSVPSAKLSFRNVGTPSPYDYFVLEFSPVFVSTYNIDSTTGEANTNETVGLAYTNLKVTFQPLLPNGSLGTPVTTGFSVSKNKPITDLP